MLNRIRNVFTRLVEREHANDTRLGCPSVDEPARLRRVNAMSAMRSGNGFRSPKRKPETDKHGRTRGDRRRAMRTAAMARVSEKRDSQFMHSAARRRAHGIEPRPMTGFVAGMEA